MARLFASISVVSLLLAGFLILSGGEQGSVLARAFRAPDPVPSEAIRAGCPGVTVTGAHSGCFVFTQIICRQASAATPYDQVIADGLLAGTGSATIRLDPAQTRFTVTVSGAVISLLGGPPRSLDPQRGADLDVDVGLAGTPSGSHLKGSISCGG